MSKLLGYNYTIQYHVGHSNVVVDALSRISEEDNSGHCYVFTIPHFQFLDELRTTLQRDDTYTQLLNGINQDPVAFSDYILQDGLILYKNRIWLPSTSLFREILMQEFHATPLGGHLGIVKTLHRLQENFFGLL